MTVTPSPRREAFILGEITRLHREHGSVAAMVDLRPALDMRGLSREAQDQSLKALSMAGRVHIFPESNRKALVQEDHDAAVWVGGEPCHLVIPA